MITGTSYILLLLLFLAGKAVADDVILQPIDGKSDPEVALFFAQGADIETQQYTDILSQLQKIVPYKLWVGIVQCQSNACSIPNTLKKGIARVEKDMITAGMNAQKNFYGGHSLGGAVIDCGSFNWKSGRNFPTLTNPDPAYHGFSFYETFGPLAYITFCHSKALRDLGPTLSPMNAFLTLIGLETLPLRMREHGANALKVAEYLENNDKVSSVTYPGISEGIERERADAYLSGGYGALIGFELPGGVESGKKFIDSLELLYHVANIGDSRSLAIHPASTTHSQLSSDEQLSAGVTPGYVRLSIGIENIEDILADIDQALKKAS